MFVIDCGSRKTWSVWAESLTVCWSASFPSEINNPFKTSTSVLFTTSQHQKRFT
jgi:hypothetical protein